MSVKWQIGEDAYLAAHYATAPVEEMVTALGRTKDAIHSRARLLKLRRPNTGRFTTDERPTGRQFPKGFVPWNAGTGKIPLRKKVIDEFVRHQERTITELAKTTGSTKSGCWKTCDGLRQQQQIHIVRYQQALGSSNNWEAVYRIGRGEDAIKPATNPPKEFHDPHKPQPVPRPQLGIWGLVWPVSQPEGVIP